MPISDEFQKQRLKKQSLWDLFLLPTLIYVPKAVKKGCKKSVSNYTSAAFYFAILFVFISFCALDGMAWLLVDHQKERCAVVRSYGMGLVCVRVSQFFVFYAICFWLSNVSNETF